MGLIRPTTWLPAFLAASGAFASDVQRFVVTQVNPQLPVMTGYVDIADAGGQPVAGLGAANLSAVVGSHSAQVTEVRQFPQTGEGVAYAFLVDISKSIGEAQFGEMRTAIQTWIAGLKPVDRAAVIVFGDDYQVLADFTADKPQLLAALDGQSPRDLHTRLYMALDRAVDLEERIDPGLPFRRVIVLLSDGKDEGSALTPDDVLLKLRASHLPVYSIGLSHLPQAEKERYLNVLQRFSIASGGFYMDSASATVPQLYTPVQEAVLRVFAVRLACPGCLADGRSYPLEITLTEGTRGMKAARFDIVPLPGPAFAVPTPAPPPVRLAWWSRIPSWVWPVTALALLIVAGLAVLRPRQIVPSSEISGNGNVNPAGGLDNAHQDISEANSVPDEGMPVRLTVVAGRDPGSSHELNLLGKAVIGRGEDCDVEVPDPEVSNHHCELALIHGQILVYDLGSTNSTYVNGVPIRGRHKLEPQDTILVGDTELRVHFEGT
jgi:hypothetical protein